MKLRVALAIWLYALAATPAAAQVKVSDLPAAATLTGPEVVPGVQSGASKKISVAQIGTYVATNPTIISAVQAGIPDATTIASGLESAADKTKLNGIAVAATANSTDAQLRDRSTHTGTQSADTLTDGTTNKAFLATERTKLTGIATGATANSTDATLLNRTNHTGTQSADTLTDGTTNKAFLATERTKLTGIATGATANTGTVTSVGVSGGTTGLTTSGGPITTSGTITLAGTLVPANGGTGSATAFTSGSVVFAGASGVYTQDNTNFNWDNTNKTLGLATASATNVRLNIKGGTTGSGAFGLYIRDSAALDLFGIRDDGALYTGSGLLSPYNQTTASAANMYVDVNKYVYRSTSSIRYKTDVRDYTRGIEDVMRLRPVFYRGKSAADAGKQFAGLIAEEVYAAGLVEFVALDNQGRPDALHYGNMIALALKAIQDQQHAITSLQAQLRALRSRRRINP